MMKIKEYRVVSDLISYLIDLILAFLKVPVSRPRIHGRKVSAFSTTGSAGLGTTIYRPDFPRDGNKKL